ncbi:hypothetical protein BV20DRAFT_198098 [Pilatotrama ljubarskyi]|nr:hypothetical protein BV20DRAFT_198098 [Pilatotrama ljubarskyi]
MFSKPSGFPLLPTEVIDMIRVIISCADLYSLVLVNRSHNMALTPHLYADIDLLRYPSAMKCIMALDHAPEGNIFGRNLSILVQSFSLREDTSYPVDASFKLLASTLVLDVLRMVNLKHFSCSLALPCSTSLLAALLSGAVPKLQSLQLTVSDIEVPPGYDVADLSSRVPRLRSVKLDIRDRIPTRMIALIRELLTSRAGDLRTLSLSCGDEHHGPPMTYLPTAAVFSALEELTITGRALAHPSLQRAPIKVLTARESDSAPYSPLMENDLHLGLGAFLTLRRLSCPYYMLPTFFPEEAHRRRPIDTVGLNYVPTSSNSNEGGCFGIPPFHIPWAMLHYLRFSKVPIRRLYLRAMHLSFALGFPEPQDIAALVTVECLVIVTRDDPWLDLVEFLHALGSKVIAQMPRLHTFVLSDEPASIQARDSPFEHAGDLDLQRRALAQYEACSSTLKTVAFTAQLHWENTADGWLQCPGKPSIRV